MKKLNNKTLGIILAVLVVAFIATKVFRSSGDTNVQPDLIQVDTSLITKIVLFPEKQHHKKLHLIRNGSGWQVVQGAHSAPADKNAVQSLLNTIAYVGIKRMVTRNKKDWDTYNISDTAATQVKVYAGNQLLVNCHVGSSSKGTGPYMQTATYVRMDSLPEVYQTQGYLASVVNKSFNDWRNHDFLRIDKKAITRLQFEYPGDSGFTVFKRDSAWMVGHQKADSARVASYLNKVYSQNMSSFADAFKPRKEPDFILSVSASKEIRVSAWSQDSSWILESSQRPGVYFKDKDSTMIRDLMINKTALLPDQK